MFCQTELRTDRTDFSRPICLKHILSFHPSYYVWKRLYFNNLFPLLKQLFSHSSIISLFFDNHIYNPNFFFGSPLFGFFINLQSFMLPTFFVPLIKVDDLRTVALSFLCFVSSAPWYGLNCLLLLQFISSIFFF